MESLVFLPLRCCRAHLRIISEISRIIAAETVVSHDVLAKQRDMPEIYLVYAPDIFVAGGKMKMVGDNFFTAEIKDAVTDPIEIAKAVAAVIPVTTHHIAFSVVHQFQGVRVIQGLIYIERDFGFFDIKDNRGGAVRVILDNKVYKKL